MGSIARAFTPAIGDPPLSPPFHGVVKNSALTIDRDRREADHDVVS
jgi:hypothetical protein